jgi:hypothetical protein
MFTPVLERPHDVGEGVQKIYKFPNGYGASVVRFCIRVGEKMHDGSYGSKAGLWELASFKSTGDDPDDFEITKIVTETNFEITKIVTETDESGIVGWLTDEDVEKFLQKISVLEQVSDLISDEMEASDD